MDKTHVAIATMTLARNADEGESLLTALEALVAPGLPVFVTDGGSDREFVERARALEGLTFTQPSRNGLWPQARRSLESARASGAAYILYTEPDKRDFFRENLEGFIDSAPADAGVVIVSRSADTLATFPAFQQYSESVINRCCSEVIGQDFDYSYGPFLLTNGLVPHLLSAPEEIGWGWRPYAFGIAHRLGLGVQALPKAAACPAEQRAEPQRVYRMQQLAEGVRGLVLSSKERL